MKITSWMKGCVVAMAAAGVLVPQGQVSAATAIKSVKQVNTTVFDVAMNAQGKLDGRVIDHAGSAVAGAEVVVRQGKTEVTKVTTDKNGTFSVAGLKGGVYEVATGKTVGQYRVWTEQAAPPKSGETAMLIVGENGERGNYGSAVNGDLLLAAAIITSIILGIIAIDRINDVDDELDQIPKSN